MYLHEMAWSAREAHILRAWLAHCENKRTHAFKLGGQLHVALLCVGHRLRSATSVTTAERRHGELKIKSCYPDFVKTRGMKRYAAGQDWKKRAGDVE